MSAPDAPLHERLLRRADMLLELGYGGCDKEFREAAAALRPPEGEVARSAADWRPIATITDHFDGFEDEVILVWSECDGLHTAWLMSEPASALTDGRYTYWAPAPPPPRQEPQRAEDEP